MEKLIINQMLHIRLCAHHCRRVISAHKPGLWSNPKLLEDVVKLCRNVGGCVLVIKNTTRCKKKESRLGFNREIKLTNFEHLPPTREWVHEMDSYTCEYL